MEKMTIRNLAMDPILERPIVLLTNKKGDKIVPIWVGIFEANAILIELEKLKTPRPITHDLMKTIMVELGIKLRRIIVTDLKDGVYYAVMEITQNERECTIDSRPSDAIAMALRFKAPIYVTDDVLEKSSSADHGAEMVEDDEMRKWIDQLKPGDFEEMDTD
ncbi:MAG TPA: bifunctional nuclease family protein [bacterium]|nr:bifunctional nuclease family protein [bacterium]